MANNLNWSKYLTVVGLSLLLACLAAGVFGWIRYEQVKFQQETEEQAKKMSVMVYLSKVLKDGQTIRTKVDTLAGLLKTNEDLKSGERYGQALTKLESECRLSLRGLEGKVSPVTSYDKDLRLVSGVSRSRHEKYRLLVEELLDTIVRLEEENKLKSTSRERYVDELTELAKKIETVTKQ